MTKKIEELWIKANWSAPSHVIAGTSIRIDWVSSPPYDKSNLSLNVGDNPNNVKKNRAMLLAHLGIKKEPIWLDPVSYTHLRANEKRGNVV